jgi:hypothetical protein
MEVRIPSLTPYKNGIPSLFLACFEQKACVKSARPARTICFPSLWPKYEVELISLWYHLGVD